MAGTPPDGANSVFAIQIANASEITWATVSGRVCAVYWSGDPDRPFVDIGVATHGDLYSDVEHTSSVLNLYRLKVELETP